MNLLVPAYGYPGTDRVLWDGLRRAADSLGHVIVNPGSGPGDVRDPAWVREVSVLTDHGVPLLGYLDLAYSAKPVDAILAEAALWRRWYGVTDFFLDCTPSSDAGRAAEVADALRTSARCGELVANPGTTTLPEVAAHFDLVVDHEGGPPLTRLGPEAVDFWPRDRGDDTGEAGGGARQGAPAKSWIVHGTDRAGAHTSLVAARMAGVAEIWVTDLAGDNPYRTLPAYWSWLLEQLAVVPLSGSEPMGVSRLAGRRQDRDAS